MVNMIIMIMLTAIIAGGATYAGLGLVRSADAISDAAVNQTRLEEVANALRANMRVVGGTLRAPAGVLGTGSYAYTQVPGWVSNNARTTNGIPFMYCPYASNNITAGSAGTVTMRSGTTYAVRTVTLDTTNNKAYVVNSAAPPSVLGSGALGVLIAPSTSDVSQTGNCSTITSATYNGLVVASGYAVPLHGGQDIYSQLHNAGDALEIYVGTAGSGDQTGRDTSNVMTMDAAMALWRAVQPRSFVVNVPAGTYTLSSTTFPTTTGIDTGNPKDMRVYFKGVGTGSSIFTGTYTINLPGTTTIEGIALGSNSTTTVGPNTRLILNGVTMGNLNITGGEVVNMAALTITTSTGVTVTNGGVFQQNAATTITTTTSPAISLTNAQWRVNSGALALTVPSAGIGLSVGNGSFFTNRSGNTVTTSASSGNPTGGINVQTGARAIILGNVATNNTPTYAIRVAGRVYVHAINITVANGATNGILLEDGGGLFMRWTTMGSSTAASTARPRYAVNDNGGSFVMSDGTTNLYTLSNASDATARCWYGAATPNLFSDSSSGATTANTSANATSVYPYLQLHNRTNWICQRT